MDIDFSFLTTKKMVYHSGVPIPFSIYEGMVETIYMLNNSVAYSSTVSPGLYVTLRKLVTALPGSIVSVVDDLLGLCVMQAHQEEGRSVHYSVQTKDIITQLTALNRIEWACPHQEGKALIPDGGIVWVANPLAFLHYWRVPEINAQVINEYPDTTFIIPIGEGTKARIALQFFANSVARDVFFGVVPCSFIDDCVVIIPGKGVTMPSIPALHVTKALKSAATGQWTLEKEKKLFQHLYG